MKLTLAQREAAVRAAAERLAEELAPLGVQGLFVFAALDDESRPGHAYAVASRFYMPPLDMPGLMGLLGQTLALISRRDNPELAEILDGIQEQAAEAAAAYVAATRGRLQ